MNAKRASSTEPIHAPHSRQGGGVLAARRSAMLSHYL
jgi:hypothetical protein